MFIADMTAPCGLDCSICKRALAETGRCWTCSACGGVISCERDPQFLFVK